MKIVPEWPPVTCNMNKNPLKFASDWRPFRYNLHASGSHSVTRQETSRQEVCKRPSLHHSYTFLALASPHPAACFLLFSWQSLDICFGKCAGTLDDIATRKQILHALMASCVRSRSFLQASCKNNYSNKKMKTPLKNLRICTTYVLNKCYLSTLYMVPSNLIRWYLALAAKNTLSAL
jgi:hypothetical protein